MQTTGAVISPPRWARRPGDRVPVLLVALIAAAAVVIALTPYPLAVVTAIAVLCLALFAIARVEEDDRFSILAAFGVALAARVAALLLLQLGYSSPINPYAFQGKDSFGYHRVGLEIAGLYAEGRPLPAYQAWGGNLSYHQVVGTLYHALGASPFIPIGANVLLGSISVLLLYAFARPILGGVGARYAAWLLALWPSAVFWSTRLLKDTLVATLILLVAVLWVRFLTTRSLRALALSVIVTLPLHGLRFYAFGFFVAGLLIALVIDQARRGRLWLAIGLVIAAVSGWAAVFELLFNQAPAAMLERLRLIDAATPGSLLSEIAGSGVGSFVVVPLAMIRFFLSPLPWKIDGLVWASLPGILCQYALLPAAVRGAFLLLRSHTLFLLPVAVVIFLTVWLHALAFLGGIPRHMSMFYPYFLVCAVAGLRGGRDWAPAWVLLPALLVAVFVMTRLL